MTHEQISREMLAAQQIRESMLARIYDGSRGIMADLHRRIIDEPWFNLQTLDLMYERHTNAEMNQGEQSFYTPLIYEPNKGQEMQQSALEAMQERMREEAQTRAMEQAQDQGMEH